MKRLEKVEQGFRDYLFGGGIHSSCYLPDQLIQAIAERLTVLSKDENFKLYSVPLLSF
ncbi:hypothetical protein [Roseofilum sp. Guam]|uniref:hypothetical protein n=1 Tax=Roseofilum sp. Guam TaxID=2821502 RepID=UPI001B2F0C3E|nr:hypothetical protein [Roseofilum sp. Guam]MBP0026871.1 hypothetical protein [Roseofilum sp. Guam]